LELNTPAPVITIRSLVMGYEVNTLQTACHPLRVRMARQNLLRIM
jgi:hypothetical protein